MIVCELHAGESAVRKPKMWFSANKISGGHDFDNSSDENIELAYSLLPIMLSFAQTEVSNSGICDL